MDAYQNCPCGSGKKVKFCCQKLLPEMEKVERLQDNQPELALQHLDKLAQKHENNPWVVQKRAAILLQLQQLKEAKLTLIRFLKEHPDHPRANAMYAIASLYSDGLPQSKKAIHRAFKRSVADSPAMVIGLLEGMSEWHLTHNRLLAGRIHLLAAMRIAQEPSVRDRLISTILELDNDSTQPFILRSGQSQPAWNVSGDLAATVEKSRRLSLLACWEEAADLLQEAAAQHAEIPELFHTLGLYRAWDGDEARAAEALQRAASLYGTDPRATECATYAQLLSRRLPEHSTAMRARRYRVTSVSQYLSRLDDHPRMQRDPDVAATGGPEDPAGGYLVLDRPRQSADEARNVTPESVPLYLGRVFVFAAQEGTGGQGTAAITAVEGEPLQALRSLFEEISGDFVQPLSDESAEGGDAPDTAVEQVLARIPNEELSFHKNYFIAPGTPGNLRAAILHDQWDNIVHRLWLDQPQAALQGQSPRQAAGNPEQRVPLEAALCVFESFAETRNQVLPIAELRRQLQLPFQQAPADFAIEEASNVELLRWDLSGLSDAGLKKLIVRLMTSPQTRLLYSALESWFGRDISNDPTSSEEGLSRATVANHLVSLASGALRYDDALRWNETALGLADARSPNHFERLMLSKFRELRIRAESQSSEQLAPLLRELWDNFGGKLPALREQLTVFVQELGIDPPWSSVILTSDSSWEPASAAQPAGKLWLPGQ